MIHALALVLVFAEDTPLPSGEGAASPGRNPIFTWGLLVLMVIMFMVMQRRAKKKAGDATAFRRELAPGQRVVTQGGMIGMISRIDGDIVTIMSASGDESAWLRRVVQGVVDDEQWEALTAEYPEESEEPEDEAPNAIDEDTPEVDKP
ncbi:MAG: preprotein translocase subunit YajC [Micrococcales bacterium]|nr:preprotein translocase subunit YajC [Micrococcales bacterium]